METKIFDFRKSLQHHTSEGEINEVAEILKGGGLVGIPTETVYGLAANGLNAEAVKQIFVAKGRPQDNPLILHIPAAQWLPRYCDDVPALAYVLARKFWPGPLTMILKAKPMIPKETTAGLDTVAMRCPNHPAALAIIRAAGVPLAAPSANTSGRPSCTSAQDVWEDMNGKIEAIVDGGPCQVGVESTILDMTCNPPRMLRAGGLSLEDIQAQIGPVEIDSAITKALSPGEKPKAPGMKYRHYAPKAPVIAVSGALNNSARTILEMSAEGDGVICFDEYADSFPNRIVQTLGRSEDKLSHAQKVFDVLRFYDSTSVTRIFAQLPDSSGLDFAVTNRLKKAAGFQIIEADRVKIVLGFTGGSGSGKTSALNAVKKLGGSVIDCDRVYHEMLLKNQQFLSRIVERFPESLNEQGVFDRKKLGNIVFRNKEYMEELNDIVYEFIVPEVESRITGMGLYAIDAINLFDSGAYRLCDKTIAVTAPLEERVKRIMERDKIDEQYAHIRISAQPSDSYFREKCDYELKNAFRSVEEFQTFAEEKLKDIIQKIKDEKRKENRGG